MASQAQMFPMSEEERIARIRSLLAKDEEKAKTKRDVAAVTLDEARETWANAHAMLATFDEMTGEIAAKRAADAAPAGVDPVTGEVEPPASRVCPDCDGDGRISDETGGGHHGTCPTCYGQGTVSASRETPPPVGESEADHSETIPADPETVDDPELRGECDADDVDLTIVFAGHTACPRPNGGICLGTGCKEFMGTVVPSEAAEASPVVVVLYPGDDEPHVIEVGEHTRYSNIVAGYFTAASINEDIAADRWLVIGEDDGGLRSLVEPISPDDYGKRLTVAEEAAASAGRRPEPARSGLEPVGNTAKC